MKRGLAAPLLFLALAFAAQGSADAAPSACAAALLALLLAAGWAMPAQQARSSLTPVAWVAGAFSVWIVATNQFANPSYSSAATYHAALFLGGYMTGRRAGPERQELLYRAALAFGVALAAWALWQQVEQVEQRAHGLLITPATFASVVNLILAPGLVLVVFARRRAALVAMLVLLAIALAATQSRGGWIALAAAMAAVVVFAWRAGLRPVQRGPATALAIVAVGVLGGWLLTAAIEAGGRAHGMLGAQAGQSLQARLELYALAVEGIAKAPWLAGAGYQAFYYLLESGRGAVPTYIEGATYFVHNDYLQTLLELGIPGLAGLLLLVALPLGQAWRVAPSAGEGRVALVAIAAAIASMAAHGLVDFPFFIPLCVLMYGAAVGLCDATALQAAPLTTIQPPSPVAASARRIVAAALVALAIWVLGLPVLAEAAATYAQRQWRAMKSESAAYWFEAARRLDPRDWRYHWYAGQFWTNLAAARADPQAARLADVAFAAGVAANVRDVRTLYDRIVMQRRLRRVLAAPVDPETLRAWSARAVALAPTHPDVLAERGRILRQFPAPKEGG